MNATLPWTQHLWIRLAAFLPVVLAIFASVELLGGDWSLSGIVLAAAGGLYLLAPFFVRRSLRKRIEAGRLPAAVEARWASLCQEYGLQIPLGLIAGEGPNGIAVGGRRSGVAAITAAAADLEAIERDVLLRHLAIQVASGMAGVISGARLVGWFTFGPVTIATLWLLVNLEIDLDYVEWLVPGAIVASLYWSARVMEWAKANVDRLVLATVGDRKLVGDLIKRSVREQPSEMREPLWVRGLWFGPRYEDDKHEGDRPKYSQMMKSRLRAVVRAGRQG